MRCLTLAGLLLGGAALAQTPPAAPAPPPAPAPAPPPTQLERVEITGGPSDTAVRRNSTASKIVISREELLRFGDSSLVELMRRLPGVTPGGRPGRGGEVRMRGMGSGFTQILVDGERMPPGFSLDQIPPDQVERIEIQRAPTAETGTRAVAGTINVILREPLARKLNEVRVQVGGDHGQPQANAAWTRNDRWDDKLNYSLTAALNARRQADDTINRVTRTQDGQLLEQRDSDARSLDERVGLNLNGRLQWRLGEGRSLMLMPFAVLANNETDTQLLQRGDPRYTRVDTHAEGTTRLLRLMGQWQQPLDESTKLEARFGGGQGRFDNDSTRRESGGLADRLEQVSSRSRDESFSLNGKINRQTANEHQWVSGAEYEWGQRDNTRTQLSNGQAVGASGDFGDQLQARTQRLAAYTQDEWQANPQWSLHGGLRYEQIDTEGDLPDGSAVRNTSRVWSPLLHALWKPDPKGKDQIRMSLTRSYRAANLNDLLARRVFNSAAPSGANTEDRPDRAGNPDLKPELATGLEFAFERYLEKGGLMSANVFYRDIQGLIRTVLAQETVSLGGVDTLRWTQRPRNLGNARSWGLELELRARVDELLDVPAAWVPLQLRANLSLFDSRVDGIPGPNNRLDAQPRGTLNLGADYKLPDSPWGFGANWSYTPEVLIQQTEILQSKTSVRRVLDAYAQYRVDASLSWRFGLANITARDALADTLIQTGGLQSLNQTLNPTYRSWTLRAELRI